MHRGYVKLYRRSYDHPFYNERRPHTRREAWEDILLHVNHSPGQAIVKNRVLHYEAGQSLRSLDEWARIFQWSKSATRRFFTLLVKLGQIRLANETRTTRLTVCHWDEYQSDPTRQATQKPTRERNGSEPLADTRQEVKNVKKKEIPPVYQSLAKTLEQAIRDTGSEAKITEKQVQSWANDMRLIVEQDKRTVEDIRQKIEAVFADKFWRQQIRSGNKLRLRWNEGKLDSLRSEPEPTQSQGNMWELPDNYGQ